MKERHPDQTPLIASSQILARVGELTKEIENEDYWEVHQRLSVAANQASDTGDFETARVVWLLSDLASISLNPISRDQPFQPRFVTSLGRPMTISDLSLEEIGFALNNVDHIQSPKLRARVFDLCWLLQRPRDVENAVKAIREYSGSQIAMDTWHDNVGPGVERAIQLSLQLNSPASTRIEQLEQRLVDTVVTATTVDGYLAHWIVDLLLKYNLARPSIAQLAGKSFDLGETFSATKGYHQARAYFQLATRCYLSLRDHSHANQMIVRCVDEWEREASEAGQANQPSAMQLNWLYENAIKTIRTIPRALRTGLGLDVRLDAFRLKLTEANLDVVRNMATIEGPSMDISGEVRQARAAVSGKTVIEAMRQLFNISNGADEAKLRGQAIESLKHQALYRLFQSVHYSGDGRVVRRVPGAKFRGDEDPEVIWAEMMTSHTLHLDLRVRALIWPALETIRLEHRLTPADFTAMCYQSSIVPPGREETMGRAIYHGYDGDFLVSTHLIVPQLENLVRYQLKMSGAKTTTLDEKFIEMENGLSTLVDMPEMEQVFGKNITFEIKALFCDSLGPNLRNEVAHGLLGDKHFDTTSAIYAWWFVGRLVFNTYLQANRQQPDAEKPGAAEPESV